MGMVSNMRVIRKLRRVDDMRSTQKGTWRVKTRQVLTYFILRCWSLFLFDHVGHIEYQVAQGWGIHSLDGQARNSREAGCFDGT
jgi:hypothetical protein